MRRSSLSGPSPEGRTSRKEEKRGVPYLAATREGETVVLNNMRSYSMLEDVSNNVLCCLVRVHRRMRDRLVEGAAFGSQWLDNCILQAGLAGLRLFNYRNVHPHVMNSRVHSPTRLPGRNGPGAAFVCAT